ncbi:MAG: hypothetical protein ACREDT_11010 [Methylocella sp.]
MTRIRILDIHLTFGALMIWEEGGSLSSVRLDCGPISSAFVAGIASASER